MIALFDTAEYTPLWSGLPIATPNQTAAGNQHNAPRQSAWCCGECGGPGPFLRNRAGASLCYACAAKAQKGK